MAGLRVSARGGLVEQQHRPLGDQRRGGLGALALPAGQQPGRPVQDLGQPQWPGDAGHRPPERGPAQPGQRPEQPQVLGHGQPRVERRLLRAHPQAGPGLAGMRERIDPGHADPAGVRAGQPAHHLDERGLARAVVAHEADDLAGGGGGPGRPDPADQPSAGPGQPAGACLPARPCVTYRPSVRDLPARPCVI